jgi:uncharacterized membrane protein YidH (DUF202 family)
VPTGVVLSDERTLSLIVLNSAETSIALIAVALGLLRLAPASIALFIAVGKEGVHPIGVELAPVTVTVTPVGIERDPSQTITKLKTLLDPLLFACM